MNNNTITVNVETEGIEEATEEVEKLADAFDTLPSQVVVKHCRDCTINIYPSQIVERGGQNGLD